MGTLPAHSFPGTGVVGRELKATDDKPLTGKPDGPDIFVPELGLTTGSFLDPCDHMRLPKDSGTTWLMHHVPRTHRGHYKTKDYPEAFVRDNRPFIDGLREDQYGYVMCTETTNAGSDCKRRAVNFAGLCQAHGGKLHPLDKVNDARRSAMAADLDPEHGFAKMNAQLVRQNAIQPEDLPGMTRLQMLLSGTITVDDLDDEELSRGQMRDKNGGFTGSPLKMIPKAMKDAMVKRLFERVNEVFKLDLISTAKTMMEIANSEVVEPADRIKAATYVLDRMLGKTPDTIVHTQEKPWEVMLGGISGGSRAASRVRRGVADEEEILEAEVVETIITVKGFEDDDPEAVDPEAYLDDIPDPLDTPTYDASKVHIPSREPYERQNEEFREEQRREHLAEKAKELKEKQKQALRQRIMARQRHSKTLEPVGYQHTTCFQKNGEGYRHRFRLPKISTNRRRVD